MVNLLSISLILFLPLFWIEHISSVCIASSTLAESILSSSPSLCFNTTNSNILNHRSNKQVESNLTIVHNKSNGGKSLKHNGFDVAESRQVPLSRNSPRKISKIYGKKRKKINSIREIQHPNHQIIRPFHYHHNSNSPSRKKSIFIPVALYSVTKKLPKNSHPKMSASNVSVKRKLSNNQHHVYKNEDQNYETYDGDEEDNDPQDDYEMRKESAVYGYIQKPEVIEFKGQYYYDDVGNQDYHDGRYQRQIHPDHEEDQIQPSYLAHDHYDHHHDYHDHHEHHEIPTYLPTHVYHETYDHEPSLTTMLLAKLKKVLLLKGITAKGLLLASLPLLLSPVLSYMLTPVVIPITATVAAGRRRRRKRQINDTMTSVNLEISDMKIKEEKIILQYLQQIKLDEKVANKVVANFLQCEGFFSPNDRCLEQLICQFSHVSNTTTTTMMMNFPLLSYQYLERELTSIILEHLLRNKFVPQKFKKRIRKALFHGKQIGQNLKKCQILFPCKRLIDET